MKYPFQVQRYLPDYWKPWLPCLNFKHLPDAILYTSEFIEGPIRVFNLETEETVYERPT